MLVETVGSDCSEVPDRVGSFVEEHKRWLADNAPLRPNGLVKVGDLDKVDAVEVNKLLHWSNVVARCDSNKVDPVTVGFVRLYDRGGFAVAGRSPGRPEPQDRVGAFERVEVKLPAADRLEHRSGERLVEHGALDRTVSSAVGSAVSRVRSGCRC